MKLICLPNQSSHFYLKPETAILRNGYAFYMPDFCTQISGALAIVVKINRLGRHIAPKFAHRYYNGVALGFCIYAADLLEESRSNGVSWGPACALDYSAPLSNHFSPFTESDQFSWEQWSGRFIGSINQTIADVSRFIFLKMGDLIWLELHAPLPLSVPSEVCVIRNGETDLSFSLR